MFGELIIQPHVTSMVHDGETFGTVRQLGVGLRERWIIRIPSLNFAGEEKSRVIAENLLIDCYCQKENYGIHNRF